MTEEMPRAGLNGKGNAPGRNDWKGNEPGRNDWKEMTRRE
jgi:hypothetical protein